MHTPPRSWLCVRRRRVLGGLILFLLSTGLTHAEAPPNKIALQAALTQELQQRWPQLGDDRIQVDAIQPALEAQRECTRWRWDWPAALKLGRNLLQAQCGSLRLQVQVQLSRWGQVLVATRALKAGEALSADGTEIREQNLAHLPDDVLRDVSQAQGLISRAPVLAQTPLRWAQFKPKPLIEQGQNITLEIVGDGFSITSEAKALQAAAVGEHVRVQSRYGKMLEGVVQPNGRVLVRP